MSVALDQRMTALAAANVVRLDMAHVKREVRAGQITVADALSDERAQRMAVGTLLAAQRQWGENRAARYLGSHYIHPRRRIEQLTDRQRNVIAGELG